MSIHPTAIVSREAEVAEGVEIGPFSVIDGPARLEAGVRIGGHVWLSGDVSIGARTTIGWGTVLGAPPQDLSFDPDTASGLRIGADNTLREYVTIHRGAKDGGFTVLGEGNFVMTGAHVGHDATLGDGNVIANNVLVGGHVTIGNKTFLGGGAGFHQFIRVGDLAIVQGNAAISQDVPPFCVAHGQNHLGGLNVVGLRRAGFDAAARADIKRAYHQLFQSGRTLRRALDEAAEVPWSEPASRLIEAVRQPSRKGVITR